MKAQMTFVCFFIVIAQAIAGGRSLSTGSLKGTVKDSEGAVVAGATVIVHWDSPGVDSTNDSTPGLKRDMRFTSDKAGRFASDLKPGFYDVAVFARGFTPRALKVRIRSRKTLCPDVMLAIDPQMSAERGDDVTPDPVPLMPAPEPRQQ